DNARLVAVCYINENNLKKAVEKTCARGFYDYKKMVEECELDIAVITLPHSLHSEATIFCAKHGLDVFLEKPMGISTEDCLNMITTCEKNGVMLWVGNLQRYIRANALAKELIDSGRLGKLVSFSETRNGEYYTSNRPAWFGIKEMAGGGIAMNLGAHALDKMKFFTNDAGIKDICGSCHFPEGVECEDGFSAFVTMENGVVGTLNIIGYTTASKYETVLYLTNGEIRMNLDENDYIEYCCYGEEFVKVPCGWADGMTGQIKDVVERLEAGNKTPAVSGEYGMDIVSAIKRLYNEE
ncbi:MAG: Gfo/Idh/MocA family oxidoreductase, partial [Oscillospiraceae bacterium]|nr:Gfo/Idh/MocA family oxidoreductase [Oscillospiraceae bacterium]